MICNNAYYDENILTNQSYASYFQSPNQINSIIKLIELIQTDLLQVQVELQDCQNKSRKLEINLKNKNLEQSNKNNEFSENKVIEFQNEMALIQDENSTMKKRLEKIIVSNTELREATDRIKGDMSKKDKLLTLKHGECKKLNDEIEELKKFFQNQTTELRSTRDKYKDKLKVLQNKISLLEKDDLMNKHTIEELGMKLKYNHDLIKEKDDMIKKCVEKYEYLDDEYKAHKESFQIDIQGYEVKVKCIIEELKLQNKRLTDDIKEFKSDNCRLKLSLEKVTETNKTVNSQLLNKDEEIKQLKSKLSNILQMEEREKLLKRELNENKVRFKEYDNKLLELSQERDRYYALTCEQDSAIQSLLNEIKKLSQQLSTNKSEHPIQFHDDKSYTTTSTDVKGNESSSNIQSGSNYDPHHLHCNPEHYDYSNITAGDDKFDTDVDSGMDNTMKKLAVIINSQDESSVVNNQNSAISDKNKSKNIYIGIDEFSKYLEEQLQMIKAASEKNMASIKHELINR